MCYIQFSSILPLPILATTLTLCQKYHEDGPQAFQWRGLDHCSGFVVEITSSGWYTVHHHSAGNSVETLKYVTAKIPKVGFAQRTTARHS